MPTYDYQCKACGHAFEELQSFSEPPLTKCPACKQDKLDRLFGGGGAIIFKGSGFYETDYRRADGGKANGKAEADGGKTETKSETKPDSAPAPAASSDSTASSGGTASGGKSESKGGSKKAK